MHGSAEGLRQKEGIMIQLTEKIAVTADERQYIVGEPRQRRGRGLELRDPRYFATMRQVVLYAISRTLREKVENGDIITLQQFVEEQGRLQEEFTKQLKGLEGI